MDFNTVKPCINRCPGGTTVIFDNAGQFVACQCTWRGNRYKTTLTVIGCNQIGLTFSLNG